MTLPTITRSVYAHYEADAIGGLSDGNTVTGWNDSGPNNHDLVTWGTPPTFQTNELNGMPGVQFQAAAALRKQSVTVPNPRTYFMVVRNVPAPTGGAQSYYMGGASTLMSRWTTSGRWVFGRSEFVFIEFTDASLQSTDCLWTFKFQATGATLRANQVQRASGNLNSDTDAVIVIGNPNNTLNPTFTMFELVIYDGLVDATDTDTIEDYLYNKWFVAPTPPDPPGGVEATVTGFTDIAVSWSDVADETGYRVERSLTGSSGWTVVSGDLAADTTSYLDEDLTPDEYFYRVIAFSDDGDSTPSSVVSAVTVGVVAVPEPGQPLHTFGGQIDVRVEVDTGPGEGFAGLWDEALWDTDRWGSDDPDWVDFTPYVLGVSTSQGAERWGERVQTGTASVTVDNHSGIFTPLSGVDDPWFRTFRPGRRLRIVAIPDPSTEVRVPLFTGRLDAVYVNASEAGYDVTATLEVVDYMGDWNGYNPLETTATGAQRTDLRVHAALDRYGWPADQRDIQVGFHNCQTSTLSETTLEECQIAADAEGGVFYCSKDGLAVFKNRDWLTTDERSVEIQGYLGYEEVPAGAQAAHIDSPLGTSWELARVINHAAYARAGGTAQEVQDLGSWSAYGVRSHKRTDFQNTTDAEVLALAVRVVNTQKDLRPRADLVTIGAVDDPDNEDLNRLLWDTELGDLVAVKVRTPYGWMIEREAHIFGIDHQITADDWLVTFRLDDAQTIELTYWTLEDEMLGVLNETTRVA